MMKTDNHSCHFYYKCVFLITVLCKMYLQYVIRSLLNSETPRLVMIYVLLSAMECTGGQVYEACGSLCDRTCRSLSGAETGCGAERACQEGCFCPAGKYLSDSGECVTTDLCPCLHDGQLYQPKDVFADHHSVWLARIYTI